jgi:hypothetical protein
LGRRILETPRILELKDRPPPTLTGSEPTFTSLSFETQIDIKLKRAEKKKKKKNQSLCP